MKNLILSLVVCLSFHHSAIAGGNDDDLQESLNEFNCSMQMLSPVGDKSVCGGRRAGGAKTVRAQNDPPAIRLFKNLWRDLFGPTVRRMSMESPRGCSEETPEQGVLEVPDSQECHETLAYDLNFTQRSGAYPLTRLKQCSYYACDVIGIEKIQSVIQEQGLEPIRDIHLFFGCSSDIAI